MKKSIFKYAFLCLIATAIVSCGSDDNTTPIAGTDDDPIVGISKTDIISNYADMVIANYEDAIADAQTLKTAIDAFVADPTENNFSAAKDTWLDSRESYGTTEAFRFADGPIDIDDDAPEGLLNAWPLDELFIDYVDGDATAGIINDLTKDVTKASLIALNGGDGGLGDAEKNVAIGYHAIEFLLWGQDITDPLDKLSGQRLYTDFVDGGTAANQDRRRAYIAICADVLVEHLQLMIDEWSEGGAYKATFLALNEDVALTNMLKSIAEMANSELAVERMEVAVLAKDQEDEHSCFSDNTHRDVRLNLEGVANVYRGSYGSVSGASLEDLITEADATLGAEITALLVTAEETMEATAIPFDFAISDTAESEKVKTAVNALKDFAEKLVEGAAALGISVNI